jgi:hypothetical protein
LVHVRVFVGLLAFLFLAGRQSHLTGISLLRHFPVQELPALAGALALAQAPEYLRHKRWVLAVLLTASGCTSLDMGVILRVANDQHGRLGAWELWLGYGSAIAAIALAAICVDARGSQQEQEEIEQEADEATRRLLGGESLAE